MPNLVPVVDSLDKVPEAARSFYEQKDGKYQLSLEGTPAGFVPAAEHAVQLGKVVEFRDKNIQLLQEVEPLRKLKTDFDGVDPVAAKDALTKVAEIGKKGVKTPDDIAALIASSVAAAVEPLKTQLTNAQKQTEDERKRADEHVMRSQVTAAFIKAGGKANASDFIITKAAEAFVVDGGVVKARSNKFSAERPGEPLSVTEWLTTVAKENDFAFEPSGGGGANPARVGTGLRAGQVELRDPTPQQLGEHAADISKGKMKVVYSTK